MYIKSLTVENFRCFKRTEIEFQFPERKDSRKFTDSKDKSPLKFPNINLLLGNNGSGKSSILKALALVTLAPVLERGSGLVLNRYVRNVSGSSSNLSDAYLSAELVLHEQDLGIDNKTTSLLKVGSKIRRRGSIEELQSVTSEVEVPIGIFEDYSPAFLVVGYGVTRRVEENNTSDPKDFLTKSRRLRYSRVSDLFDSNYKLLPLPLWLPHLKTENKGRYAQAVHLIDRLTPSDMEFEGEFNEGEFWFNFRGVKTPFGALSDGYKGFIGWIGDLVYHIFLGCPKGKKLVDSRGLVLVDEIDLLLHPEWQRTVISSLSEFLPNLQFVFTTHSPIVSSSVEKENVFVMETDDDGSAIIKQYDENIYGHTAEQVLLSSYFGLNTTRAASFVKAELEPLSKNAMDGDKDASIDFLKRLNEPMTIDKSKFPDF